MRFAHDRLIVRLFLQSPQDRSHLAAAGDILARRRMEIRSRANEIPGSRSEARSQPWKGFVGIALEFIPVWSPRAIRPRPAMN